MKVISAAIAIFASVLAGTARADIPIVQHVVIIIQENRTPDNLFHGLQNVLPKADIAASGSDSSGNTITLTQVPMALQYGLGHQHADFLAMYAGGKLNGADLVTCRPNGGVCPPDASFAYVDPADDAPYFALAENYGFANRMFQSNQGPSMPAHQFLFGATAQPTATSVFYQEDNPTPEVGREGCDAAPNVWVNLIGPDGMTSMTHPCFEHATLTDLIDNPPKSARQGLTWRYYTPSEGSIWTAPDAIRHMCQASGVPLECNGKIWADGHIVTNPAQVLSDVAQNKLQSVSWVIPTGAESDHVGVTDGSGPSWVASVVNAIGQSPYWANTVILITWDDWGGWYDHVAPPIDPHASYYVNGFRVPLLVVSAYTPAGYVSQTTHTFGSVLKFVETAFGLPSIPPGTFVDSRADNLLDFFDFSAQPRKFAPIPARLGPSYFLNDKRPLLDPDDE